MNTQPEIKAGQRWESGETEAEVVFVTEEYVFYIFSHDNDKKHANGDSKKSFAEYYRLKPELKTRPITKDDIMKMLAEDSSLYFRTNSEGWWYYLSCPEGLKTFDGYQFSHNPFAPNAEIAGPEIEVKE